MAGFKLSHLVAGFLAVLVGYTSSVAIIFRAIEVVGATQAQANSWMLALGLGMGISGFLLSWLYKMPVLTAWSTPGAALLVISLQGVSLPEATGAFVFCALLLLATGLTGWFETLSRLIPMPIASALLAGILFRFGLEVFTSLQSDLPLVAVLCLTYLLGKRFFPRFGIPAVLAVGIVMSWATGDFHSGEALSLALAKPEFVMPAFSLPVLIGVGLPLYIVTMASQNVPGVAVMQAAGYEKPPVSASLVVTGLTSLILAPFGGYAFNLAAITAAICANEEADPDPRTRYRAALVAGVIYCIVGLFGAAIIGLFLIAPKALIVTVAGLALMGTIGNGLSQALARPEQREAALVTFMTTASGIAFLHIGAPLWALIFGLITEAVLRPRRATA
ncbi:benzoate/H(+) symporter BenE family transporter [Pseudooceanicola sp. CBS1P-1]|uniref:Benzoate/H(+) symporter BenE family transporter n=1 Tax=Pseudooceanicola albus TaxID=2692189 RepID=A0A6L7G6S3_9RHOB|nr:MULTISPECIES: benzoate/H(+) symporter BenE family transporter [Pseudooceanicola]MBT9383030.1 benzoate/H(+) symporter BenE family transporter [Pseudooceanicola endophyticus]MXN19218.1 benzoate/H(+) symporter BenE family transporter [Pseudooceanicola albus]